MTRVPEAVLLLLVGVMCGPNGTGLLSTTALAIVDPAVPVALVALGALVGLHSSMQGRREKRLLAAAATEAAVTAVLVTAGMLIAVPGWGLGSDPRVAYGGQTPLSSGFVAVALGVCAATSAAGLRRAAGEGVIAERIGDLDALLPIGVGAVALAWLRTSSPTEAMLLVLQACGIALVIVAAAWLLIGTASSETEQRVFTAALLLLLGGAADYLALSALLSGLVAGLFLGRAGGPARDAISRDILQFQRPLVALILLVAGARVDLPLAWAGAGITFVPIRTAAKLAGGWTATRVAGATAPRHLGIDLLPPGVLGLAFALNALRATSADGAIVLAVATVGMVGSELLAALARPSKAPS